MRVELLPHCGAVGVDGGVAVTLFAGGPTSSNGVLAEGTIEDGDVDGSCASTVAELLTAMAGGDTYVNVHTIANGGGEIRGQIK